MMSGASVCGERVPVPADASVVEIAPAVVGFSVGEANVIASESSVVVAVTVGIACDWQQFTMHSAPFVQAALAAPLCGIRPAGQT
jgi:hypothetical protein